ncbi:MAG TPA: DUF167 domain-containing protein [Acidobacteriaceae bacterium]|nr:DUF167 domain-containing protein [Acidobacteriaceae bacterium]
MKQTGAWVKQGRDGATFAVRVAPRASRTAITGLMGVGPDAVVKIALAAAPVEGKANAALVAYLAGVLDVPRSRVGVTGGKQSKNKVICVHGADAAEVAAKLAQALPDNCS